jgi:hypothetical protein
MEAFICEKYGHKYQDVDDDIGHIGRHLQIIAHIKDLSLTDFLGDVLFINGYKLPSTPLSSYDTALVEAAASRAGWSGKR